MGNKKVDWKKEKERIEYLINEKGFSIRDVTKFYGYKSHSSVSKQIKKAGIEIDINKQNKARKENSKKYYCRYCGKEFENEFQCGGHVSHCKENPNFEHNLQIINNARKCINKDISTAHDLRYCRYCGKEVHGNGCLTIHEKSCTLNPECEKNPNRNGNGGIHAGHVIWNKGKTMLTDERVLKGTQARKAHIREGIINIQPHKHSEKTKQIIREKMIEHIKKNGNGEFGQHFSKRGCEFINELNEKNGWNLQHALNGGEKQVCGYFLDGYDEELNIAFEYDESRHYKDVVNNILNDKDVERQNIIKNELGCTFYRYNETIDKLYQV